MSKTISNEDEKRYFKDRIIPKCALFYRQGNEFVRNAI